MNAKLKRFAQTGFTLVELLIVVIILAILAAIVIPQFSSATVDAKEAGLDGNLAAMRSAIELYRAQHNGKYPGGTAASGIGAIACTGTVSTGAIDTAQAWMDHLLMSSDAAGNTCSISDSVTYKFGPYLRKGIPAEPINSKGGNAIGTVGPSDIVAQATGAALTAAVGGPGGWKVDTKSGQIIMNSGDPDSKTPAKAYSTH